MSVDDKQRVGRALLEDLVSTGAVQKEEAERYGAELIPNWGKPLSMAGKGAVGGAAAGTAIPLIGTMWGAIAGGTLGAIEGIVDAMNDPGGLRFVPDPEGFSKMVELIQTKQDVAIRINETTAALMKKGMPLVQAQKLAEASVMQELKAQQTEQAK